MDEGELKMKIGVGAVVFRGDEVLIIRRGKPPFEGKWSIPGGALHHGERLMDAARREVMEETALEIRIGGLIGAFEALPEMTEGAAHIVLIDYWAEWVAGEPVAGDDAAAAEFVSYEEALSRVSWDETRIAIASALKLRNIDRTRP
ncbi:MAG TPA: NUDIX hydrolase [Parvularculaceae bacterium]|nr:NUDIX hydrolase [Parvularculaceae bacterium]